MNIKTGLNNAYNFFSNAYNNFNNNNRTTEDKLIAGMFLCLFTAACYVKRPELAAIISMRIIIDTLPVERTFPAGINQPMNQAPANLPAPIHYNTYPA
ncbi:MAG: hypothetical protein EPN84_00535 [Legionella sp.]|nr:MAG: hypothetical protein EPN84_00535 [Legionella sp.]